MYSQAHIEFLNASVSWQDAHVALTPRQADLLGVLAIKSRPVSRHEIAQTIWPDKRSAEDCGVFDVALHRLRRNLGAANLVLRTPFGYKLADGVKTDIDEMEHLAANARAIGSMSRQEAAALGDAFEQLTRSLHVNRVPAVPSVLEPRIRALVAEIGGRLCAQALRCGNFDEALRMAERLLGIDPLDEAAWEVTIRAHMAQNRHSEALRAFRRYSHELEEELGVRPSPHMARLLDDEPPRSRVA